MFRLVFASVLASLLLGCAGQQRPVMWREMLGKSIEAFSDPLPENNQQKVWIHNMDDKECDKGCGKGVEVLVAGGGAPALPSLPAMPSLGGMFGGGGPSDSKSSAFDGLAFEVFSNYMTQKRKGRVVEQHHHNYMTEQVIDTHRKVDVIADGKSVATYSSCEDLCTLDEAKKRKADKILAYQILEMKPDELLIHLRYSDGRTGIVELARTVRVKGQSVIDNSF
jgi:hypothetical protein